MRRFQAGRRVHQGPPSIPDTPSRPLIVVFFSCDVATLKVGQPRDLSTFSFRITQNTKSEIRGVAVRVGGSRGPPSGDQENQQDV